MDVTARKMRAGEEFSEMAELGGGYRWAGGGGWGRTPPPSGGRYPPGSYEAEDAHGPVPGHRSGGRTGLYYSPPGTSYTIVERPSSHHTSRADYAQYNSTKAPPRGNYLIDFNTFAGGKPPGNHSNCFQKPFLPFLLPGLKFNCKQFYKFE